MTVLSRNLILASVGLALALSPVTAMADRLVTRWIREPRRTVHTVHGRRVIRTEFHWVRKRIRIPTDERARHHRGKHKGWAKHRHHALALYRTERPFQVTLPRERPDSTAVAAPHAKLTGQARGAHQGMRTMPLTAHAEISPTTNTIG